MLLHLLFCCSPEVNENPVSDTRTVLLSGNVSKSSVILQARFAASDSLIDYDIPGIETSGSFQISTDSNFNMIEETKWVSATTNNDFMIKEQLNGLKPFTTYYYRIKSLTKNNLDTSYSSVGVFKTFAEPEQPIDASFAISTGFNYEKFYGTDTGEGSQSKGAPASGIDRKLGFEAFEAVQSLNPDFFIANGDVVYYDKPGKQKELWARDLETMRAKWHRYFAMPRNRALCLSMPVFYLKDDHDYRFNDCDTTDIKFSEPSHQLGNDVFKEQVPVTDPTNKKSKTYRTIRTGKLLQVWFLEGRDYRSPNGQEDTPQKTLWGREQKEWLMRTLQESEATFKILISPTPLIGPDDAYKKDNHTNSGGFQSEQQEFFEWLLSHNFLEKNFYIVCGDRHWQYHSIHPNGFEEFSSGAFVNQNSRKGRKPGDPKSTDPEALITSPFLQFDEPGGGFLYVTVRLEGNQPVLNISFRDTNGNERYASKKPAL